jgi:hypothetical protein
MRTFTVEEANALLPTVRTKLIKIKTYQQRLAAHHETAKSAAEAGEQGGGGIANGVHYANLLLGLTDAISEIEALGVQIKDFERGLVDFPSLRDGRVVLLCWQLGDGDQVEWWHDVDAGFAGRTPL